MSLRKIMPSAELTFAFSEKLRHGWEKWGKGSGVCGVSCGRLLGWVDQRQLHCVLCLWETNASWIQVLNVLFQPYMSYSSVHCESFFLLSFCRCFCVYLMIFQILNELFLYLAIVIQKVGEKSTRAFTVFVMGAERFRVQTVMCSWGMGTRESEHLVTWCFFLIVKGESPSQEIKVAAWPMGILIFL